MTMPNTTILFQSSGVSAFTGEPFIEIHWGNQVGQLTVEEARIHAFALLECCEAALSDAFLFKFARDRAGMDSERAAQLLAHFREYREGRQPPPEIPENEK